MGALTEFRIEVSGRLGAIEEHIKLGDAARAELEEKVDGLVVEAAVAKRTGARAGRKWGSAFGVFVVAVAESIRSIFG
jgi:hypothetical protein